eukprot:PhF_6_TR6299/c0_g1_i4/m.9546
MDENYSSYQPPIRKVTPPPGAPPNNNLKAIYKQQGVGGGGNEVMDMFNTSRQQQHPPPRPLVEIVNIPPLPSSRPQPKTPTQTQRPVFQQNTMSSAADAFTRLTSGELGTSFNPNTRGTQTDFGHAGLTVGATCVECLQGGNQFVCIQCVHGLQKKIVELASAHEQLLSMHRQLQSYTERLVRAPSVENTAPMLIPGLQVAPQGPSSQHPETVPARLYSIGLGTLAPLFQEHEIDMAILKDL